MDAPPGYEYILRKAHNRRSAWQEFLKNNGEYKAFMDEMSALYRQQYGGQPQPLAQYRSSKGGAVYTGGRVRGRGLPFDVVAGERMFEEGHNPWLKFIHEHKGDGYSLEELSRMYHQLYGRR